MTLPESITRYDAPLRHCDFCGAIMGYEENATSEFIYADGIVYLCYEDRIFVTTANLAVSGQLAIDKASRDEAFSLYIATAINPETSEEVNYPWF